MCIDKHTGLRRRIYLHAVIHPMLLHHDKMFGSNVCLQSVRLHLLKNVMIKQRRLKLQANVTDRNRGRFCFVARPDSSNQNKIIR